MAVNHKGFIMEKMNNKGVHSQENTYGITYLYVGKDQ